MVGPKSAGNERRSGRTELGGSPAITPEREAPEEAGRESVTAARGVDDVNRERGYPLGTVGVNDQGPISAACRDDATDAPLKERAAAGFELRGAGEAEDLLVVRQ